MYAHLPNATACYGKLPNFIAFLRIFVQHSMSQLHQTFKNCVLRSLGMKSQPLQSFMVTSLYFFVRLVPIFYPFGPIFLELVKLLGT